MLPTITGATQRISAHEMSAQTTSLAGLETLLSNSPLSSTARYGMSLQARRDRFQPYNTGRVD